MNQQIDIGDNFTAKFDDKLLVLIEGIAATNVMVLDKEQFEELSKFAKEIGWFSYPAEVQAVLKAARTLYIASIKGVSPDDCDFDDACNDLSKAYRVYEKMEAKDEA